MKSLSEVLPRIRRAVTSSLQNNSNMFYRASTSFSSSSFSSSSAPSCDKQYKVGVLGCTGMVGQQFIYYLRQHPNFVIHKLGASERSAGKAYKDAVNWKLLHDIPEKVADKQVVLADVQHFGECDFVFSALDTQPATKIESEFAQAGFPVFSNASSYRMDPSVPILIPDVNPDHLSAITTQSTFNNNHNNNNNNDDNNNNNNTNNDTKNARGFIVTNANCSTTGLTIGLKPLVDAFGLEKIMVVTMQALSGAGYPGVSSLDVLDNLVPHIGGEEPKLEAETLKIFGEFNSERCQFENRDNLVVSAMCNRVPVFDGHTECVSIKFSTPGVTPEDVSRVLQEYSSQVQELNLPSAPERPIQVIDKADRPQPRLDRMAGDGFTTSIGGIRRCNLFDVKLTLLSHNTVIGAAGGSILNAELAMVKGYLG